MAQEEGIELKWASTCLASIRLWILSQAPDRQQDGILNPGWRLVWTVCLSWPLLGWIDVSVCLSWPLLDQWVLSLGYGIKKSFDLCCCFLKMLGCKPRFLLMLDRCSTTKLHPQTSILNLKPREKQASSTWRKYSCSPPHRLRSRRNVCMGVESGKLRDK